MSESRRLNVSQTLIESLRKIDQAGQRYKAEHREDHLYEKALEKPLREKRNNTRIDYVDDFANNFAKMRHFKEEVESMPAKIKFEIGFAGIIQFPLLWLLEDIELFKQAPNISPEAQQACKDAIIELKKLDNTADQLLLLGYRNKLNDLVEVLGKLEKAAEQYKQEHQAADHLYEETLEAPLKQKLNVQTNLNFVKDFVENCQSICSHINDLEEKSADSSLQLTYIKELANPIGHLLEKVSLFKKAAKVDEAEQKTCESAIKGLNELKEITETLFVTKSK